MPSILILEDQYTKSISRGLQQYFPNATFPITDEIKDPMQYTTLFSTADIILLDNYFPGRTGGWEEPYGCEVLEHLMQQHIDTNVICISDYQETLVGKYDIRKKAHTMGLVCGFPSKDIDRIAQHITALRSPLQQG